MRFLTFWLTIITTLFFSNTLVGNSDFETHTVCVPVGECLQLIINDTYGDGINQAGDYYFLTVDGDTIIQEANYNFGPNEMYSFNCPQGSTCFDPFTAVTDVGMKEHLMIVGMNSLQHKMVCMK
jgi:hypothetical protein